MKKIVYSMILGTGAAFVAPTVQADVDAGYKAASDSVSEVYRRGTTKSAATEAKPKFRLIPRIGKRDVTPNVKAAAPVARTYQRTSTASAPSYSASSYSDGNQLPPNPEPGVCYVRLTIPEKYDVITEEVMVKPPSSRLEPVPAEYEWAEERVLIREASTRLETVPAKYETRDVKVMTRPSRSTIVTIPPTYETVTEKVLVKPGRTYWKAGADPLEQVEGQAGDIMCLVTEPPEYRTVTRQVLKTPATSKEETIPAEYTTVKKTVMTQPPTTRSVPVPEEYQTMKVQKLVRPATTRSVDIPAQFETVEKRVMTQPSSMAWRKVLCKQNVTADVITEIQNALKARGYDPGAIDGKSSPKTAAAIRKFQADKNLPQGSLTYNFLNALGVSAR